MLDRVWPRQACRRRDAHWRADTCGPLGSSPRATYYAAAPLWYRAFTHFWGGFRWVKV